MTVAEILDRFDGVASYRTLDACGVERRAVRVALSVGEIRRVRGRWFASPHAVADVVRAVTVGGTLTGASVGRLRGLWMLEDHRLHVRVPATASRLASPADRRRPLDSDIDAVCVHYSRRPGTHRSVDAPLDALVEMFVCGTATAAIVAVDSALNLHVIRPGDLVALREMLPAEKRRLVDRVDPGAQSGLETLIRLLLHSRRIRYRSQVQIARAGRVDILVGDRLVLELDGRAFHTGDAFEEDRRRDLELVMQGYIVVRLSYSMVMSRWDDVSEAILELVRRREHLWGGSRPGAPLTYTFTGSARR
ncbi:MAG: DUF559 domain-containing protein [Leifsonia sp.]